MGIVLKFSYAYLFIFILSYPVSASYENNYIKAETIKIIKKDAPSFIDLMVYLPLLNRVVDFCEQNQKILSINLAHGLFLISVHLEPFVTDIDIPEALRIDIENLLVRSEKLKTEFNSINDGHMRKVLAALTSNATAWSKRMPKLNFDLLHKTFALGDYPQWDKYLSTVEAIDAGVPSPSLSDKCVGALTASQENLSEDMSWRCEVPNECYKSIINGTDFGYWLTHRLILLLLARFSRNCAIFSAHEDQIFRISFCEKAYREVEYIALNGFQIADLVLEQIAVCALDGHAQFLRRSWLVSLLEYQQPSGCFQLYKLRPTDTPDIKNCDGHAMAVAMATYAAAVRLILDNLKRTIE